MEEKEVGGGSSPDSETQTSPMKERDKPGTDSGASEERRNPKQPPYKGPERRKK